jgi:TonB-linked SusC/RagA family outer membrane protein
MKKLRDVDCFFRKRGKKLLMSGNSLLILLLLTLNIHAGVLSQTVNLNLKSGTLKDCFKEIEKQTGLGFLYTSKDISKIDNISVSYENENVETVLKEILEGTGLDYKIENGVILIVKEQKGADTPAPVQQQKRKIIGKVTDENGITLPGVTVVFRAKNETGIAGGNTTAPDGSYSIEVPDVQGSLTFSFVGYENQVIPVTNQSLINVTLKTSVQKIEEVVATGIFLKKAETYTGAATSVKGEELQQFGNKSVLTSLRNIDPSFNIIENNTWGSDPNRLPEIQIRGVSSIPNVDQLQDETRVGLNTPLIILDGFQSSLQRLLDINENEVERIDILKDAAATAIYGSRGSNGVIIITTKMPQEGKLRVTVKSDLNIEVPDLSAYDYLNAREKLDLERKAGLYDNARAENDVPLKRYYNDVLAEVNRGVDTYWLSQPLRTGLGQRHNLRLEGGDHRFRYSVSAQINNIEAVMKESSRNLFNGTINLTYNYKNIKFTNSLLIGLGKASESPYGLFSDYVTMNPYWRPFNDDGSVIKTMGYYGNNDWAYRWSPLPTNPLYNATLNTFDITNTTDIVNNFSVEWRIIGDLVLRAKLGLSKTNSQNDDFKPADHTMFANYSEADILRKGMYTLGIGNNFLIDGSLNLNYSKLVAGKHSIYAGLDYNMREEQKTEYTLVAEGFTNANLDFLSMALQYPQGGKPTGKEGLNRAVGITGNANYTYDNRYLSDVSFRLDGSSQFGAKNRFAPFWSAGLGWNLHNEKFFNSFGVIDRFKIRGSIGTTGTQNFSSYQALSTYRYYTSDRYFTWVGSYLLGLGNEKLRWEQKTKGNVGFETQVLKNRLSLMADVYLEKTNNLVSTINLPSSSGFAGYVENIGKLENRGYELKATAIVIRNTVKKISWSVSAAVMHNQDKLIEISQALKDAQKTLENAKTTNPNMLFKEGYSMNTIWVVESLGIDPGSGKEVYLDRNGNITYTWNALDLKAMGNTEPKLRGNLNSTFRYHAWSMNVSFGYRLGGQLYNQTLIDKVENANFGYNVDSRVYDNRWQKPGDNAAFKGLLVTATTYKSSRFIQDETTLTCQNINLKYDFEPSGFIRKFGLTNLTLNGNTSNLFYFSTVKQERGIKYPFSKQFSLGITAIF